MNNTIDWRHGEDFGDGYVITQHDNGFTVTLNGQELGDYDTYVDAMLTLPNECFAF